jgi:hypothetical protein
MSGQEGIDRLLQAEQDATDIVSKARKGGLSSPSRAALHLRRRAAPGLPSRRVTYLALPCAATRPRRGVGAARQQLMLSRTKILHWLVVARPVGWIRTPKR